MSGFFIGKSHNFKMLILLKKIILCWLIKLTYSSNLPVVASFPTVRCVFYSKKQSGGGGGGEGKVFIHPFLHFANIHGVSHHNWCYGTFKDE